MQRHSFVFRWFPVLIWMGVIYIVSSSSDPFRVVPEKVSMQEETIGRISHMLEYAILAVLVFRGMMLGSRATISKELVLKTFAIPVIYSVFDELHQSFVPRRSFQFLDLSLDLIGIILGLGVSYFVWRERKN